MEYRKPNCKCFECEKEIYRRPFQLEKGKVYCSATCLNIKKKKPDIICKICGKLFSRKKHSLTCSISCFNISKIGMRYNKENIPYKSLKQKLIEKFSLSKCNRCECDKMEILQVHHIIERKNGGNDDLNNLELLCSNCHTEHHHGSKTKD